jgi:putative FmdB family regulatory protein
MPLYEYECAACGHRFEQIRKFSDPPVEICPNCGEAKVQKLVSSPAIQFKGTGWYITDYAKKSSGGTDTKSGAAKESGDSKESGESKESVKSSESKESGKSKESKESKESKTTAPAVGTSSPAKASGE